MQFSTYAPEVGDIIVLNDIPRTIVLVTTSAVTLDDGRELSREEEAGEPCLFFVERRGDMGPNYTVVLGGLLAAIDDGDDGVLPILADVMEELYDPRSAGLRLLLRGGYRPAPMKRWHDSPITYWWVSPQNPFPWSSHESASPPEGGTLTSELWERLVASLPVTRRGNAKIWKQVDFPSRSVAYLAMSEAVMSDPAAVVD